MEIDQDFMDDFDDPDWPVDFKPTSKLHPCSRCGNKILSDNEYCTDCRLQIKDAQRVMEGKTRRGKKADDRPINSLMEWGGRTERRPYGGRLDEGFRMMEGGK